MAISQMQIEQDGAIRPKKREREDSNKNGRGEETRNLIKYEIIFLKAELRVLEL